MNVVYLFLDYKLPNSCAKSFYKLQIYNLLHMTIFFVIYFAQLLAKKYAYLKAIQIWVIIHYSTLNRWYFLNLESHYCTGMMQAGIADRDWIFFCAQAIYLSIIKVKMITKGNNSYNMFLNHNFSYINISKTPFLYQVQARLQLILIWKYLILDHPAL